MEQSVNSIVPYERMVEEVDTLTVVTSLEDLNSEYIATDDLVIATDGFMHYTDFGTGRYIIHRATFVLCGYVHSDGTGVKLHLYIFGKVHEDGWSAICDSINAMKDAYKGGNKS
ncbi:MAG: hypothetical protein NC489_09140 [Ruminococcus flavefaciens]|nr:hypothetical protein [Ruminococcus flavefaciens]